MFAWITFIKLKCIHGNLLIVSFTQKLIKLILICSILNYVLLDSKLKKNGEIDSWFKIDGICLRSLRCLHYYILSFLLLKIFSYNQVNLLNYLLTLVVNLQQVAKLLKSDP
jgi:hypothetical protein